MEERRRKRRPVRGEARCKGGGNWGDDAGWRRSGRTIPCQDLRRRLQPRRRGVCRGPEREKQAAQARLDPQGRLRRDQLLQKVLQEVPEVPEVGRGANGNSAGNNQRFQ